jgi:hypothetical protein
MQWELDLVQEVDTTSQPQQCLLPLKYWGQHWPVEKTHLQPLQNLVF